jgi:predicted nucleic acid-binding protein
MSATERFFDTKVLLYLLSADDFRADRAESELSASGVLSVQVLNEFASVASRKLKMSISEIREVLAAIRAVCKIVPLCEETHDLGLRVAERHGLTIYDAMIVASALLAGCRTVVSEDMQDRQILEGRLEVRNPST